MLSLMYFHIDIPMPVIKEGIKFATPQAIDSYSYMKVGTGVLSEEFINWLELRGFAPKKFFNGLLFYAHPGTATSVHIDEGPKHQWSLNCLLGEGDVEVQWCAPKGQSVSKFGGIDYTTFDADSPVLESTRVKSTVCRVGVPHRSINHGQGAWVFSMRMEPNNLSWPFLYNRFTHELT